MLQRDYRLPVTVTQNLSPEYSHRSPYFTAKVFSSALPRSRFGFIVSKKVSPHAVARNGVKRQLRALIEELLPRFASGYDILFIVQKDAVQAEQLEMKRALLHFLTSRALIT
jgi:ribonuclease P protein component